MKLLFTLYFSLFAAIAFSQKALDIDWQKTIGGDANDILMEVQHLADGNYILGGFSYSEPTGDKTTPRLGEGDYWVLKVDSAGSILWQNSYGGTSNDVLSSIKPTSDGGFILGGTASGSYLVIKIDSVGTSEWQKTYGGSGDDELQIALPTNDGGYILGGYSDSYLFPYGNKTEPSILIDYWIIKIDSTGNIEWQRTLGGSGNEFFQDLVQTSDNGYLICGHSPSGISGNKTAPLIGLDDYWIIKLNPAGATQWERSIGGTKVDMAETVIETADKGFIIGGHSDSNISGNKTQNKRGMNDYWIVKTDSIGNVEWDRTYGGSDLDFESALNITADGGYIVGGYSSSKLTGDKSETRIGMYDFWLLKLDSAGIIEWQNTLGGIGADILTSVEEMPDHCYIIGGYSDSQISGDKTDARKGYSDYWLVKLFPCDSAITFYYDFDNDGYGNALIDTILYTCTDSIPKLYVRVAGDCNDSSNLINPLISEICNGIDDNCDGSIDEGIGIISVITPMGPVSFCAGENVLLNAPVDASYTYQWKKNGVNIIGETSANYTANNTGQYQVYISNGTCDDLSDSISVVKNAKPNPTINNLDATNNVCIDPSIKLKTANVTGSTYQWYKGAALVTGATSNIYFATAAGNYKVKVTNGTGCSKTSAAYTVINACREMQDAFSDIQIYPNPSNGNFTIQFPEMKNDPVIISVKNVVGDEIYSEQINISELNHTIQLNKNAGSGIYFVEIKTTDGILSQQIIITR